MRSVTNSARGPNSRTLALRLLCAYAAFAGIVDLVRIVSGRGSIVYLLCCIVLVALAIACARKTSGVIGLIGDWLPLVALPLLYAGAPWSMVGPSGRMYDSVVQGWDQSLFGTQPSRTMAAAVPSAALSEMLHLAYLSYYVIIYLPPLVLYLRPGRHGFHETVWAFTMTMVMSFVAFSVFPVAGPRYVWGAPAGLSETGRIRHFVVYLLAHGSSRGTAFPSSHVAIALAQSLSSLKWRRPLGAALAIATVLLAVGAIYGGFHYATDVVAGAALGAICWYGAKALERRPIAGEGP